MTLSDDQVADIVAARDARVRTWLEWAHRHAGPAPWGEPPPRATVPETRRRRGERLLNRVAVHVVTGSDPDALVREHVQSREAGAAPGGPLLGYRLEPDGVDEDGRAVYALFLIVARRR